MFEEEGNESKEENSEIPTLTKNISNAKLFGIMTPLVLFLVAAITYTTTPQLYIKFEVGQVWCSKSDIDNPYVKSPSCAEIISMKEGYLEWKRTDLVIFDYGSKNGSEYSFYIQYSVKQTGEVLK